MAITPFPLLAAYGGEYFCPYDPSGQAKLTMKNPAFRALIREGPREAAAVERAQHMNHVLRARRASLSELRTQCETKIREYQYAISEIDRELAVG